MSEFPKIGEDAAVAAAESKLNELKAELAKAERERDALAKSRPDVSDRDRAALAMIGGHSADGSSTGNVDELADKIATLRRAIELQTAARDQAAAEASKQIAEAARPAYEALLKRGAKAMRDVVAFIKAEADFREQLTDSDVRFAAELRPMPLQGRIEPGEADTFVGWLNEYAQHYAA
jgi:hypothetical protein